RINRLYSDGVFSWFKPNFLSEFPTSTGKRDTVVDSDFSGFTDFTFHLNSLFGKSIKGISLCWLANFNDRSLIIKDDRGALRRITYIIGRIFSSHIKIIRTSV